MNKSISDNKYDIFMKMRHWPRGKTIRGLGEETVLCTDGSVWSFLEYNKDDIMKFYKIGESNNETK